MKRVIKYSFPFLFLIAIYFLGPEPSQPHFGLNLPEVPRDPDALETYIASREALHKIKKDNEARIIWNDSSRQRTEYSVVYLHGFSASQAEGDPIHKRFAKTFGCNLYLPRLADHGIDTTEQLLDFSAERLWESAKEALVIGHALGEKVILMSTSTGGTVALMLAAYYPSEVYSLINMSPNIAINNPAAFLLNDPWGLQIARLVSGGNYQVTDYTPERQAYWNEKYRLESLVQLEELLEDQMTPSTFERVTQPSLTLYYYEDEEHQDPTVKVSAMLKMNEELGTPDSLKQAVAIPGAGAHVLGSYLVSKDLDSVWEAIQLFAIQKMHLVPKDTTASAAGVSSGS